MLTITVLSFAIAAVFVTGEESSVKDPEAFVTCVKKLNACAGEQESEEPTFMGGDPCEAEAKMKKGMTCLNDQMNVTECSEFSTMMESEVTTEVAKIPSGIKLEGTTPLEKIASLMELGCRAKTSAPSGCEVEMGTCLGEVDMEDTCMIHNKVTADAAAIKCLQTAFLKDVCATFKTDHEARLKTQGITGATFFDMIVASAKVGCESQDRCTKDISTCFASGTNMEDKCSLNKQITASANVGKCVTPVFATDACASFREKHEKVFTVYKLQGTTFTEKMAAYIAFACESSAGTAPECLKGMQGCFGSTVNIGDPCRVSEGLQDERLLKCILAEMEKSVCAPTKTAYETVAKLAGLTGTFSDLLRGFARKECETAGSKDTSVSGDDQCGAKMNVCFPDGVNFEDHCSIYGALIASAKATTCAEEFLKTPDCAGARAEVDIGIKLGVTGATYMDKVKNWLLGNCKKSNPYYECTNQKLKSCFSASTDLMNPCSTLPELRDPAVMKCLLAGLEDGVCSSLKAYFGNEINQTEVTGKNYGQKLMSITRMGCRDRMREGRTNLCMVTIQKCGFELEKGNDACYNAEEFKRNLSCYSDAATGVCRFDLADYTDGAALAVSKGLTVNKTSMASTLVSVSELECKGSISGFRKERHDKQCEQALSACGFNHDKGDNACYQAIEFKRNLTCYNEVAEKWCNNKIQDYVTGARLALAKGMWIDRSSLGAMIVNVAEYECEGHISGFRQEERMMPVCQAKLQRCGWDQRARVEKGACYEATEIARNFSCYQAAAYDECRYELHDYEAGAQMAEAAGIKVNRTGAAATVLHVAKLDCEGKIKDFRKPPTASPCDQAVAECGLNKAKLADEGACYEATEYLRNSSCYSLAAETWCRKEVESFGYGYKIAMELGLSTAVNKTDAAGFVASIAKLECEGKIRFRGPSKEEEEACHVAVKGCGYNTDVRKEDEPCYQAKFFVEKEACMRKTMDVCKGPLEQFLLGADMAEAKGYRIDRSTDYSAMVNVVQYECKGMLSGFRYSGEEGAERPSGCGIALTMCGYDPMKAAMNLACYETQEFRRNIACYSKAAEGDCRDEIGQYMLGAELAESKKLTIDRSSVGSTIVTTTELECKGLISGFRPDEEMRSAAADAEVVTEDPRDKACGASFEKCFAGKDIPYPDNAMDPRGAPEMCWFNNEISAIMDCLSPAMAVEACKGMRFGVMEQYNMVLPGVGRPDSIKELWNAAKNACGRVTLKKPAASDGSGSGAPSIDTDTCGPKIMKDCFSELRGARIPKMPEDFWSIDFAAKMCKFNDYMESYAECLSPIMNLPDCTKMFAAVGKSYKAAFPAIDTSAELATIIDDAVDACYSGEMRVSQDLFGINIKQVYREVTRQAKMIFRKNATAQAEIGTCLADFGECMAPKLLFPADIELHCGELTGQLKEGYGVCGKAVLARTQCKTMNKLTAQKLSKQLRMPSRYKTVTALFDALCGTGAQTASESSVAGDSGDATTAVSVLKKKKARKSNERPEVKEMRKKMLTSNKATCKAPKAAQAFSEIPKKVTAGFSELAMLLLLTESLTLKANKKTEYKANCKFIRGLVNKARLEGKKAVKTAKVGVDVCNEGATAEYVCDNFQLIPAAVVEWCVENARDFPANCEEGVAPPKMNKASSERAAAGVTGFGHFSVSADDPEVDDGVSTTMRPKDQKRPKKTATCYNLAPRGSEAWETTIGSEKVSVMAQHDSVKDIDVSGSTVSVQKPGVIKFKIEKGDLTEAGEIEIDVEANDDTVKAAASKTIKGVTVEYSKASGATSTVHSFDIKIAENNLFCKATLLRKLDETTGGLLQYNCRMPEEMLSNAYGVAIDGCDGEEIPSDLFENAKKAGKLERKTRTAAQETALLKKFDDEENEFIPAMEATNAFLEEYTDDEEETYDSFDFMDESFEFPEEDLSTDTAPAAEIGEFGELDGVNGNFDLESSLAAAKELLAKTGRRRRAVRTKRDATSTCTADCDAGKNAGSLDEQQWGDCKSDCIADPEYGNLIVSSYQQATLADEELKSQDSVATKSEDSGSGGSNTGYQRMGVANLAPAILLLLASLL